MHQVSFWELYAGAIEYLFIASSTNVHCFQFTVSPVHAAQFLSFQNSM